MGQKRDKPLLGSAGTEKEGQRPARPARGLAGGTSAPQRCRPSDHEPEADEFDLTPATPRSTVAAVLGVPSARQVCPAGPRLDGSFSPLSLRSHFSTVLLSSLPTQPPVISHGERTTVTVVTPDPSLSTCPGNSE